MFVPMSTSTGTDQHCGSPFFELNQYGVMGMDQLDFLCWRGLEFGRSSGLRGGHEGKSMCVA